MLDLKLFMSFRSNRSTYFFKKYKQVFIILLKKYLLLLLFYYIKSYIYFVNSNIKNVDLNKKSNKSL